MLIITWPTPTVKSESGIPSVPNNTSRAAPKTTNGITNGMEAIPRKTLLPGNLNLTMPIAAIVPRIVETRDVVMPNIRLLRTDRSNSLALNNATYHFKVKPLNKSDKILVDRFRDIYPNKYDNLRFSK